MPAQVRWMCLMLIVGLALASDDAKCTSDLSPAATVGFVIGTIVGAATLVTLASFAAGLAPWSSPCSTDGAD